MCVSTVLSPEHVGRLGRSLQEDEGHRMRLSELARDCERFSIKEVEKQTDQTNQETAWKIINSVENSCLGKEKSFSGVQCIRFTLYHSHLHGCEDVNTACGSNQTVASW